MYNFWGGLCSFFTKHIIFYSAIPKSVKIPQMKKITVTLFNVCILLLGIQNANAASYDTLPKNVNTMVFKQVMTSKIQSKYNSTNEESSLNLKEEFTSSRLEDVSSVIKSYFQELRAISPDAYSNFSLGEFSADIQADVTAQGIGYGFGITDRLTIYGSMPIYHIKTDIKFKQTKASSLAAIQSSVRNSSPDTSIGKFVKDLTLQLPNTNAELLQSLVVNQLENGKKMDWVILKLD
jgi:hypothetical protein